MIDPDLVIVNWLFEFLACYSMGMADRTYAEVSKIRVDLSMFNLIKQTVRNSWNFITRSNMHDDKRPVTEKNGDIRSDSKIYFPTPYTEL